MSHTPGPWRLGVWRTGCFQHQWNAHPHDGTCLQETRFLSYEEQIAWGWQHLDRMALAAKQQESGDISTTIATEHPFGIVVRLFYVERSDANLMVAAPDLLAACKLALGAFQRNEAIDWSALERAIAKAETGKDEPTGVS